MQIRIFWPTQRLMPCRQQRQIFCDNVQLKTDTGYALNQQGSTVKHLEQKWCCKGPGISSNQF